MKKNILIIAAKKSSRRVECINECQKYNFHYLDLPYSSRDNAFNFDILAYLDRARSYINKNNIDGIFYHSDIGSLVAAQLCQEFNLPGPSLESIFLAFHKYYTRIKTNHALIFDYFDISLPKCTLKYPFYLKAPCSSLGMLGYVITDEKEFKGKLQKIRVQLPEMTKAVFPLFKQYIDLERYPLATKQIMMAEALVDQFQITVEGFVYNDQVYFTVITDTNNFFSSKKIDNFSLPSTLSNAIQEKIKETAEKDIKAIGLNNSFFNCEYWVENEITLIEINGRAASAFYNLYQHVYKYDVFEAGIQLCLGQKPDISLSKQGFGGQFNILTEKEGNSSDIIHFARLPKSCSTFVQPNSKIVQFSQYGRVIAQVELFGNSYDEIKNQADTIRKNVMKENMC